MRFEKRGILAQAALAGALILPLVLTFGAVRAQNNLYVMKITLPTLHDAIHQVALNYAAAVEKDPWGLDFRHKMQKDWVAQGGELINLPQDEQAQMMKTLASVGEDVSKTSPSLHDAYETVVAAAKRTAPGVGQ